ncbi:MAG: hypothetical protein SFX73_09015 [Kofleriaceae bacterium]|nr:hypothetical protein [Kofleriaceae bacterium]
MSEPADDEHVPRLPRGHGLKLDSAMMFRIATTLALLVMIVVTARPCADATSKFVTDFGEEGSAGAGNAMPRPGNVDMPREPRLEDYEVLRPDMTEAEQRAVIERAKAKAAAAAAGQRSGTATGSAATGSAATGSAGSGI